MEVPESFAFCVKCGAEKEGGLECPKCGVVYAKAEAAQREKTEATIRDSLAKEPGEKIPLGDRVVRGVMIYGTACILMVIVFFSISYRGEREETAEEKAEYAARMQRNKLYEDRKRYVLIAAEQAVLRVLKAPASAQFPANPPFLVETSDQITWYVSGMVDAQNSFGALIRNSWSVKIYSDPNCQDYSSSACWKILEGPLVDSP